MRHATLLAALSVGMLALSSTLAQAAMVTDANGMTLYTFDKDEGGVSSCYDDCAAKWPPYLGKAEDKMAEGWTLGDRTDGTKQWAYDGKPVYFYVDDKAKGDAAGDGMNGVWHVIER